MKTKVATLLAHITGWLVFLYLPLLFISGQNENVSLSSLILSAPYWLFALSFIAVFYIHSYLLIPLVYQRKNVIVYGLSILLLLVAFYQLRPFDYLISHATRAGISDNRLMPEPMRPQPPAGNRTPPGPPPPADNRPPTSNPPPAGDRAPSDNRDPSYNLPPQQNRTGKAPFFDLVSMVLYLLLLILSWGIKITENWKSATEREARAEADKASAELSFLKAQINPHFLFNTLNNIYALTIRQCPDAAEAVLKLAKIMRYITNEAHRDFVPLGNELEVIADYIAIQQLRLGPKTQVTFTINGEASDQLVTPLIMMTYIENAFKYGVSKQEASIIEIEVSVQENTLRFFCKNKAFENSHPGESTGIGIANTQKRLAHLYQGKHNLMVDKNDGFFTVHLTLLLT